MSAPASTDRFSHYTYGELSASCMPLFKTGWRAMFLALIVLGIALLATRADYFIPFIAIFLPGLLALIVWVNQPRKGLPFFALFVVQQTAIYSVPLVVGNETIEQYGHETLNLASLLTGFFFICLTLGWYVGKGMVTAKPSRLNWSELSGSGQQNKILQWAIMLLCANLAFQIANRTGLIWFFLQGPLVGLFPIIRTFAGIGGMIGGMLGGMSIQSRSGPWFWILLVTIIIFSIADVLLSAASGIVLATALGLALGKHKIPWRFLAIALVTIGFLNQGKFVMRERYWNTQTENSRVSIAEFPAFYAEWIQASVDLILSDDQYYETRDGQFILERVNNLQNMLFIVQALEYFDYEPLGGKTYQMLPAVIVPRIIWSDKPRTHEGQALLNIHFGRQSSMSDTYTTYIAWGLLPEAIGNFGYFLGTLLGGVVIGGLLGICETLSIHKRIFSVEGMLLAGGILLLATSYEMASGVFVAALFQALVAIGAAGMALYTMTNRT